MPNIKNNVKAYRIKKGITQEALAEMIEVTRQTAGLIEKGLYNPTIHLCLKLSQILGASLDELFNIRRNVNETR